MCLKSSVYLKENIVIKLLDISLGDDFVFNTKRKGDIIKIVKGGPHQTEKPLRSKGNHQQNEKAANQMGENSGKLYTAFLHYQK